MVQVRRGYPLVLARHLKCPIDSRYTDSADSAIQARGLFGASNPRSARGGGRLAGSVVVAVMADSNRSERRGR
jgi:hypothetical protein